VEHQKLKSYHFATDNSPERAAWVDALTHAATLQNDDDDARFILLIRFALFVLFWLHYLTLPLE